MKKRMLIKTSVFPASARDVFRKLMDFRALQKVAYPLATFTPVDETQSNTWQLNGKYRFRFKLFGIIPFGIHTIHVVGLDANKMEIYTREHNPHVPIWNHRIILEPKSLSTTLYTDEVEIFAGWKTPFIYLWSKCFYAHRQRRWVRFLKEDSLNEQA